MSISPRASSARACFTIPIAFLILAATSMVPPGADTNGWTIPARDYASTRYSELSQITAGNVGGLRLAWSFSTGVLRGHEAAPIVAKGTMYVVTLPTRRSAG